MCHKANGMNKLDERVIQSNVVFFKFFEWVVELGAFDDLSNLVKSSELP